MDELKPACDGKTDLFFSELRHDRLEAMRICATCPLLERCRARVLASPNRERGIWGGLSEGQRARLRSGRSAPVVVPVEPVEVRWLARARVAACGTDSGYYHHLRQLGEPACHACLYAHACSAAARRARRRGAGWCWECAEGKHKGCIGRGCCCPRCSSVAAA